MYFPSVRKSASRVVGGGTTLATAFGGFFSNVRWNADCIFAVTNTKPTGQAFYADLKGRLAKYGRAPDSLRVMPGCAVYVGRTASEADENRVQ